MPNQDKKTQLLLSFVSNHDGMTQIAAPSQSHDVAPEIAPNRAP